MCVDGATRGKDWSDLGPWGGCSEPGKKTVTVMISDSCPCHHPNSGNKRWCCGDRTHLDLSYAAFDQIAVRHRGVVDLKVRPADCQKQGERGVLRVRRSSSHHTPERRHDGTKLYDDSVCE